MVSGALGTPCSGVCEELEGTGLTDLSTLCGSSWPMAGPAMPLERGLSSQT